MDLQHPLMQLLYHIHNQCNRHSNTSKSVSQQTLLSIHCIKTHSSLDRLYRKPARPPCKPWEEISSIHRVWEQCYPGNLFNQRCLQTDVQFAFAADLTRVSQRRRQTVPKLRVLNLDKYYTPDLYLRTLERGEKTTIEARVGRNGQQILGSERPSGHIGFLLLALLFLTFIFLSLTCCLQRDIKCLSRQRFIRLGIKTAKKQ